ncbi:hypothetical protein AB0L05_17215 [Nonomuraea pusilla]|uniref:hypothetical protein n=1 Tax=Nonomuraea pusilla TaxID=46177 RepID=UPI00332E9452
MSPKPLVIVALALIGAGLLVGFIPVSSQGVNCGSAFAASKDARIADFTHAISADSRGVSLESLSPVEYACTDLRGVVRMPALVLLFAGVALLGTAGVVSARRPQPSSS